MKKKHAWIWFISLIFLIIVTIPIFISWICSGIIVADPRVHYLNGLGQIAGFFGKTETKSELTYKASMMHEDLVAVEVKFGSLEEMNEVMDNLSFTNKRKKVGRYYTRRNEEDAKCTFEVKSSAEQDFREAIKEAKGIKEAREAEEARKIEEAEERVRRKRTWTMTPKPLPVAPRNFQMPRIEQAEQAADGDAEEAP
jgi:hypothetical protein